MTVGLRYIWITLLCGFGLVGCNSPNSEHGPVVDSAVLPSVEAGRQVFGVGGCKSCHIEPNAPETTPPRLGGGVKLTTQFGVFFAPNISPDPKTGIGNWSEADFFNAMQNGLSPKREHYFPTFPYPSYARMTDQDIRNLWAYLKTLPPVENVVPGHDVRFPLRSRRAAGLWKQLYFKPERPIPILETSAEISRGQYLVEGPGHCAECHTPRGAFGGFDYTRWLAGGDAPDGEGWVPNITPHDTGLGDWSKDEIVASLTPRSTHYDAEPDALGMDSVRRNLAVLSIADRRAIAAYLMALKPVPTK